MSHEAKRRLPIGAEVQQDGRTHFRLWAPRRRTVEVILEGPTEGVFSLQAEADGYFAAFAPAAAGTRYRFRLDEEAKRYPDPASRFQPEGPHGPFQIVDPSPFAWTDHDWRGVSLPGKVIYEMHLGTFAREGTWEAAARELPELKAAGITVMEIMPLADFAGEFGWGYDGVNLFAPTRLYGTPDDARRFIDRAHSLSLGVLHDVVYNHFGPDGDYLNQFSDDYISDHHKTDWGPAINYDGANCGPVREYATANAAYWIDEFHFDGLRLDATQNIYDDTAGEHILTAIGRSERAAAKGRAKILVAENEPQQRVPDPADPATFARCKLDFSEREKHAEMYALHHDLLWLRREEAVFRAQHPGGVEGAVLAPQAFVVRFFGARGDDRLLLVNLGSDLLLAPAPEPLLAPDRGASWEVLWSSEDPCYGGDSAVAEERGTVGVCRASRPW
jgi:1,4-alpha-glucan branching enzyme